MSGNLESIPHFFRPSLVVSDDEAVVLLASGAPLPAIPTGNRGLVGEMEDCLVLEAAGAAREDFLDG